MDNRFTVKDFFLFALLLVGIVTVVLAMFQYDRQLVRLKSLESQSTQQTTQLAEIAREIRGLREVIERQPRTVVSSTQQTAPSDTPATQVAGGAPDPKDAFYRQKQAMQNPDYATGDWFIQNLGAKLGKLTPLLSSDVYARNIENRILECLAYRDPDTLQFRPLLATEWSQSADGMRINFKLRQGVQFSDGKPMSADDVVFTFDFICNEEIDAPRLRAYYKENIERVEKVNDHEVNFIFKKPYFESFELAASLSVMPKHFYGKFSAKEFNESVGLLMGTGPYRLKDPESWRPGTTVDLVRNERYWGVPPTFDRLLYYEVENDAAELTMFRNREIDTFPAQPEQYEAMKDDKSITDRTNFFRYSPVTGGYTYVAWNQKRGDKPTLFADKRVRQALTMLIDRERMAKDLFRGYAAVAAGPFQAGNKQNAPEVKAWPFDPKRALALLKEAGFEDRNKDGVLESADDKRFEFSLVYNNGNPLSERIALMVKDGLGRAGIVVKQEPTDWPIMVKKLDNKDFDAITLGWSGGAETDIFQMFHSSQTVVGGDNYMNFVNPELDKLIDTARATVDEAKRMPLWQQCHRILHEEQPYTFLLNREALLFVDKRIKNIQKTRSGLNFIQGWVMPMPWYVPKAEQAHSN